MGDLLPGEHLKSKILKPIQSPLLDSMAANKIALITDSTCDIPQTLLEQYHIRVVPQVIIWGEEELRDRVDIQPKDFYQRLQESAQLPTTSQPPLQDFALSYRQAQEAGAREAVVITVSGAMSGTFQIAQQATQFAEIPVHLIDSRGPTMSLGWQVLAAARERECGGNAASMIDKAAQVRQRLAQYVFLDSIEYLYKGGRIGSASRLVGTLLNIKPLVRINHESGEVEAAGRARTRRKGLAMMVEKFFNDIGSQGEMHIAVLHGNACGLAHELAERIRREYNPAELLVNMTGPVLGVNTGPGALALCGYAQ
ncbi:MAG: DegV family protein [Anaerolineales bacterium]